MSGQRIDDRSFWAGKGSKDSVFPMGCKMRSIGDVEGAGDVSRYEDTENAIESLQKRNVSKAESHDMKEGYRN